MLAEVRRELLGIEEETAAIVARAAAAADAAHENANRDRELRAKHAALTRELAPVRPIRLYSFDA